jgi:hypothetical protein
LVVHALKKLHEMGFKTFHPYINEDYDLEEDPLQKNANDRKRNSKF